MSLIRIRRERRQQGSGAVKKPMSLLRLFMLLVAVLGIIWWLSTRF